MDINYNSCILGDGYTDEKGHIAFKINRDIFRSWRELLKTQGLKLGDLKTSISIRTYLVDHTGKIIDRVADGFLIDPFELMHIESKVVKLHVSSHEISKVTGQNKNILSGKVRITRRLVEHKELIGEWVPVVWISNGRLDTYAASLSIYHIMIRLGLGVEYPTGEMLFEFGEVTIVLTNSLGGGCYNIPPGHSKYDAFKADLIYEKYLIEDELGKIIEINHEVKVGYIYVNSEGLSSYRCY